MYKCGTRVPVCLPACLHGCLPDCLAVCLSAFVLGSAVLEDSIVAETYVPHSLVKVSLHKFKYGVLNPKPIGP